MKLIDNALLKETISDMKNAYPPEDLPTQEEIKLAIKRIKTDYKNSKSRIPELRQEFISHQIVLKKSRSSQNHDSFNSTLNDIVNEANSYEDDYIYLMHMTYQTAKEISRLIVEIITTGQELKILGDQLIMMSKGYPLKEEVVELSNKMLDKKLVLEVVRKELRIFKVMSIYYDKLFDKNFIGNMKLTNI